MVDERSKGKPLLLLENHEGRTYPEFLRPKKLVGTRRYQELRANAPNKRFRFVRRKEETLDRISEPELARRPDHVVLRDDREDRSRDNVPVLVKGKRDHRLKIHGISEPALVRTHSKVEIVLKWNTYQRRDRIRQLLSQLLRIFWSSLLLA